MHICVLKLFFYFRILAENNGRETSEKLTILVSLSPQAILSIAAKYSLGTDECAQKLASRWKKLFIRYENIAVQFPSPPISNHVKD